MIEVNPANVNSRIVSERLPSGHTLRIDVSVGHDLRRPGRLTKATIGMHSFGSMTPDDAKAVAKALGVAVKVANKLDKKNEKATMKALYHTGKKK